MGALVLLSDSLGSFRLSPIELGSILLVVNCAVLALTLFWCVRRWREEQQRLSWRMGAALTSTEQFLLCDIMAGRFSVSPHFPDGNGDSSAHSAGSSQQERESSAETTAPMGSKHGQDSALPRLERSERAKRQRRREWEQEILEQVLIPSKDVVLLKRVGAGAYGVRVLCCGTLFPS